MLREMICANIKRARIESGMQQGQLAEMVGAAQSQVSRWERNVSPELETIELLAEVLGKPVYWFFLPNEGAATPDTVVISRTWASKLAALYRGMAAVNPALEPLPNSLTVCESQNANPASKPYRFLPQDAVAIASAADMNWVSKKLDDQSQEDCVSIENLLRLANQSSKGSC